MNRRFFLLALILCGQPVWASTVSEAPSVSLDLIQTMRLASEKNPQSLVSDQRVQQAAEQLNQARGFFFPTVSGAASWQRQTRNLESFGLPSTSAATPSVVGPFNVFDARVEITQTLFDLGMIRRFQAARVSKDLSSLESKKIKQDVMALAGVLYIEASRARDAVGLAKTLLRLSHKKYRLARLQHQNGTGSELSDREAKAQLSGARAQYRASVTQAQEKSMDLKAALGINAATFLILEDTLMDSKAVQSISKKDRHGNQEHPDVLVAEKSTQLQAAALSAQKADYFPTISAAADYGTNGKDADNTKETYVYGLKASWPFFEAGRREARIAESDSRYQESRIQAQDTRRRTENRAIRSERLVKDAKALLLAKTDERRYWQEKKENVSSQYKNGSVSLLEWMEASAGLSRADDEWKEALATYNTARIEWAHALGQMQTLIKN